MYSSDFYSNFHPGLRAVERHGPGCQYEGAPGPHDHPVGARGNWLPVISPMNRLVTEQISEVVATYSSNMCTIHVIQTDIKSEQCPYILCLYVLLSPPFFCYCGRSSSQRSKCLPTSPPPSEVCVTGAEGLTPPTTQTHSTLIFCYTLHGVLRGCIAGRFFSLDNLRNHALPYVYHHQQVWPRVARWQQSGPGCSAAGWCLLQWVELCDNRGHRLWPGDHHHSWDWPQVKQSHTQGQQGICSISNICFKVTSQLINRIGWHSLFEGLQFQKVFPRISSIEEWNLALIVRNEGTVFNWYVFN